MTIYTNHLVIGGLGFIGEHLAYRLLKSGYNVIILTRPSSLEKRKILARKLEKAGIIIKISKFNKITKEDIIRGKPGVIYQLAGKPSGPRRIQYEAHVNLTRIAASVAGELGVRIVYVSSIAVAADAAKKSPGSVITDLDVPPGPEAKFSTIHAETKALGERMVVEHARRGKWVIIRPALTYGPGEHHREIKLLVLATGSRIKPLLHGVPVVNVLDVANITALAGEGAFNSKVVHAVATNFDLSDIISRMCRSKCITLPFNWTLSFGRIAPRSSMIRLAWSLIKNKYKYVSKILHNYPWRLEPIL